MIITEHDIQAAEAEAERLARELAEAEQGAVGWSATSAEQQAGHLGGLMLRSRAAAVRVEQLRATAAEQAAVAKARAKREAAAGNAIDKMAQSLDASQQRLVEAVTAGEAALLAAAQAAQAHNSLVAAHRAELAALGLTADDGIDHETADMGRSGVRIRGRWFPGVEAGAVLTRSLRAVARAVLGQRHDMTLRLLRLGDTDRLERSGVLADVPALAEAEQPAPMWPTRPARDMQPAELAPELVRRERARLAKP